MKFFFAFILFLCVVTTSKGDAEVVVAEQVAVALDQDNIEVVNQALNDGATTAVASAFSSAQKKGNSKVLATTIYKVMSSNPPKSKISNQMVKTLELIQRNQGCQQFTQIFIEIDGLIASDEISQQLQEAISGSKAILDCLQVFTLPGNSPSVVPIPVVPPQDLCVPQICYWWQRDLRYLPDQARQQCHPRWECHFTGYRQHHDCVNNCLS